MAEESSQTVLSELIDEILPIVPGLTNLLKTKNQSIRCWMWKW